MLRMTRPLQHTFRRSRAGLSAKQTGPSVLSIAVRTWTPWTSADCQPASRCSTRDGTQAFGMDVASLLVFIRYVAAARVRGY